MGFLLAVLLVAGAPGCRLSTANPYPKAPKVRVEGPPGAVFDFGVTYSEGVTALHDSINNTSSMSTEKIPDSGVFWKDLETGHKGVFVQVNGAGLTLTLFDGSREIQREKRNGDKAIVSAGEVF